MTTWLIDTALFKMLASPKAASLRNWLEANDASLFLSAASLTEIAAGIAKMPASQSHRAQALRAWFDEFATRYADRIHVVDPEIATRAGALLPSLRNGYPRHRLHDALLVATAQAHGHGLLTRRDGVFGPWTQTPIAVI
jgi:hypothetical protein